MTKAYLINTRAGTISETSFNDLADVQKLIGTDVIEAAFVWPSGDCLFVDEEGMLRGNQVFFHIAVRTDQMLAGNGLLVGAEVEGEQYPNGYTNADPRMTIEALRALVKFV